jgi:radical SAM superfamily enzyme with C-terminal helix-hairpin-helix motif
VRSREAFSRFKRDVRREVDEPMLARIVPNRRVLRGVYTELREGGLTFGRQIGTYPLLVGLPYPMDLDVKVDVAVTGRGPRSVGGILYPTEVNTAKLSMLQAVPGIGKRRAMAIVRRRPFAKEEDLWDLFDERDALESAKFHLSCREVAGR